MRKRWIIRSLFLLPLVCVVGVWVGSYFGELSLYKVSGGHFWFVRAVQGASGIDRESVPGPDSPLRFDFMAGETAKTWPFGATKLGFFAGRMQRFSDCVEFVFPLWFPTLLLLALNLLVWRKTKPKPIGRAFPVESISKPGGSNP